MTKNQTAPRVRLTSHSTNISNIVLLGYQQLSDGAKLTYMVLESYDWPDETGFSKGKCWPTIESLATTRGKSYDTITRHLKELETANLIKIESGQERGAANCYWLLEPSQDETQLYLTRYSKKAGQPSEAMEPAETLPQICTTTSRKFAPLPPANLQDKESNLSQESRIKKDSNPLRTLNFRESAKPAEVKIDGKAKTTQSAYLSRLMDDFSRLFNDLAHAASNRTQIQNLFQQSYLAEADFTTLLYEAKKRTQWASLANAATTSSGPNRAAYFFQVVRDLLGQKGKIVSSYATIPEAKPELVLSL